MNGVGIGEGGVVYFFSVFIWELMIYFRVFYFQSSFIRVEVPLQVYTVATSSK